ncbi:DUF2281 domain-containing protein [Methylomonas rosea]|uniref:DUF2281 domain-containing protein n=1 Tax=Methylomonas rosea TaxID=2952227 RepID=A0ABT1TUM9_9GAMM|nr:DUF2281 domain-containing protein [Methylomonas sp. WSC-7]MCQ8118283.1 DUF2281 domain-containing protein [Methylomonas sp. WSC-7]
MYTAIKGTYENGQVIFEETPPTNKNMKVLIIFLEEAEAPLTQRQPGNLNRLGSLQGNGYSIPDDFNDPLDDLKEYM